MKHDDKTIELLRNNGYRFATNITLKAKTKDELVEKIRMLEHNWAIALERNNNQFALLMKNDIEKEKYKWHDLRKNPDDLPKEHHNYLPIKESSFSDKIIVKTDKIPFPFVAYINLSVREWFNPLTEEPLTKKEFGNVIAWRYIEPFEGVE